MNSEAEISVHETTFEEREEWRADNAPQEDAPPAKKLKGAPRFYMDGDGRLIMSIHALVVDTGERRIVVDTCIGNDKQRSIPNWTNLQTSFLADLEAAGYPRETIDTVLCTHLHVDHVGWNTMLVDGEWVPTFPNARHFAPAIEVAETTGYTLSPFQIYATELYFDAVRESEFLRHTILVNGTDSPTKIVEGWLSRVVRLGSWITLELSSSRTMERRTRVSVKSRIPRALNPLRSDSHRPMSKGKVPPLAIPMLS